MKILVEEIKDTYLTIGKESSGLYKEKGSRFISFGYPITSEIQALDIVKKIKDRYHDARHHCWAYRLGVDGENYRINDDGEPSGTAGRPILGALKSHNLTNVIFIVVRYFGGIKLGTSGLIEAYKTATESAIADSAIIESIVMVDAPFEFSYGHIGQVMKILKQKGIQMKKVNLEQEPCNLTIQVRQRDYEQIIQTLTDIDSVKFL